MVQNGHYNYNSFIFQESRGFDYRNSFWKVLQSKDRYRIFYKGSLLSFLRVFPHNIVTLIVWDFLRKKHQNS